MAKFINETMGLVSEADLLQTGINFVSTPSDPLESLFTDQVTENLVAEWYTMASEYSIPVMAQFHAFDVPAQKSERAPIDEQNVEKALIKVKRNTSELLRQLMKRGTKLEDNLYNEVMNDAYKLTMEVVTRAKMTRHELMATGQVTIKENGLNEVIDFGVPNDHKGITLDFGGDILEQIEAIVEQASDEGVTINGIVCPRSFISKLRKDKNVQLAINGSAMQGVLPRRGVVTDLLDEEFGISQVITVDGKYAEPYKTRTNGRPDVVKHRLFPANTVTFFGTYNGSRLGAGLWGTPPEVEIANFAKVDNSGTSPFVYITQWAEKDPAIIWTKASALYVPVLFAPQSLFIATYTDGGNEGGGEEGGGETDLNSMTKTQLLEYAEANGITGVDSSMTKDEIIAVIEAAQA